MKKINFSLYSMLAVLFMVLSASYCEVTDVSAPCAIELGDDLTISARIRNQTHLDAVLPVNYYRSYDRFLDPEDILIGSDNIDIGPYGIQTSVLNVPGNIDGPVGKYFIIVHPFNGNYMYRAIEVKGQQEIGVDYVPTNLTLDDHKIFFTLENFGSLLGGSCDVQVLLSKNLEKDAADIVMHEWSLGFDMPGNSRKDINVNLEVPENLQPGQYYILIVTDSDDNVAETAEDNNMVSEPISVQDNSPEKPVNITPSKEKFIPGPISVWPNPASDYVNIGFQLDAPAQMTLEVVDQGGRILTRSNEQEIDRGDHSTQIDLRGVPNGLYVIRGALDGRPFARKIVVQR